MLLIYIKVENVIDWMNLLAIGGKPSKLWEVTASESTVKIEKVKDS